MEWASDIAWTAADRTRFDQPLGRAAPNAADVDMEAPEKDPEKSRPWPRITRCVRTASGGEGAVQFRWHPLRRRGRRSGPGRPGVASSYMGSPESIPG